MTPAELSRELALVRVNLKTGEILDASGKVVARVVPPLSNEHDAKIIADLESMASQTALGFWPRALSNSVLRMLSAAHIDLEGVAVDAPVMFVAREHLHERPVGLTNPVRVKTCYALDGHKEPTAEQVQAVRDALGIKP